MKKEMEIKKEEAAFEMLGSSYDGDGELVEVSYADLRAANIGDMWEPSRPTRGAQAADGGGGEVVYKTERGAAVLFRNWGTTDDPNPEHWESAPKLVWYEFA